jgi:1,4-alpha-glucan branching enzyme
MNRSQPSLFHRHLHLRAPILASSILLFALGAGTALADNPKQSSDLVAKKTDGGILFQCSAPGASAVYLAGDFNNWADNSDGIISDAKHKMEGPDANGVWQKTINLSPGTHKFKFNLGGTKEGWFAPEWAKQDSDGNGLIEITDGGDVAGLAGTSSPPASEPKAEGQGGPKVTFHFTAPDASAVYLAGDFNNWADNKEGAVSDSKYAMSKGDGGVWKTELALTPGRHSYKFVVDGSRWENDPGTSEKDSSGNSVVEVK